MIGDCAADDGQLTAALRHVQEGRWRDLTKWPGCYLAVAAHGPLTAVIGDLVGQHPVYWRPTDRGHWWATSATALAGLDVAPVDPGALGLHLAFGQADLLGERSLFRDVHRVPPGHVLLIDSGQARTEQYEPAEYEPVPLTKAAPTVAAALRLAVAVRVDGRSSVSSDLAGLDSTTLACIAAEYGPVTAATFTDPRIRDDDLAYARRTAAAVPGLRHRVVTGGKGSAYYSGLDDLSHLPATDFPSPYTVTAAIKRAVLAAVSDQTGPGLHFTGTAGDTVLSAAGYLPDLLRRHAWGTALSHAQARARLGRTSVWTVLRRALPAARSTVQGSLRQAAVELRHPPCPWDPNVHSALTFTPQLATAGWMPPRMRGQLADALDDTASNLADAAVLLSAWTDRQDLLHLGADIGGWRALAEEYDVEVAAPYLDNEVIRACLAVPAEQRGTPGRFKPLLAAAFPRGPIPEFVLSRTTKGGFNGVSYAGLREHAATIAGLLGSDSRLAALGLVTNEPVAAVLQRAAAGQRAPQGALHLAVAAEVWLRQLNVSRNAWWEEVSSNVATA